MRREMRREIEERACGETAQNKSPGARGELGKARCRCTVLCKMCLNFRPQLSGQICRSFAWDDCRFKIASKTYLENKRGGILPADVHCMTQYHTPPLPILNEF